MIRKAVEKVRVGHWKLYGKGFEVFGICQRKKWDFNMSKIKQTYSAYEKRNHILYSICNHSKKQIGCLAFHQHLPNILICNPSQICRRLILLMNTIYIVRYNQRKKSIFSLKYNWMYIELFHSIIFFWIKIALSNSN